ncbi:MAG: hypothetical protein FWD46_07025 [Cystobacterineae bacterium]|nr:hypothetical protein [Cystobacterineae bacterium]
MMKLRWMFLFVATMALVGCSCGDDCDVDADCDGENQVCNEDKKCVDKEVIPPPSEDESCDAENPCEGEGEVCQPGEEDADKGTCVIPIEGCTEEQTSVCNATNSVCSITHGEPESVECNPADDELDLSACEEANNEDGCDTDSEVCYVAAGETEGNCVGYDETEPSAECFEEVDDGSGNMVMAPKCELCVATAAKAEQIACVSAACAGPCDGDEVCVLEDEVAGCVKIEELPAACTTSANVSTCAADEVCGEGEVCFKPIEAAAEEE